VTAQPLTFCLTVGLDAMSLWITSFKSDNPSMISRGEFDVVGTRRVLELLDRHEIRSTFLVPGHTALAYPDLIREITSKGHELAYHGWCHEDPRDFDVDGQRRIIQRGLEALEAVSGVRPRGHVAPAWNMSADTMALIEEFGFEFDGSRMATDCLAVYLRKGDEWSVDEPYRFGELTDIVGLPVAWPLDDVPLFEFVWGQISGLASPSAVEEIWRGDLDYAREHCPGGIFNLTIHPQVTGRGHRMMLIERLLDYATSLDDVVFARQSEYVERWRAANPLAEWRRANPELAGDSALNTVAPSSPA
jgi:peptidoglycan/xylan/chitin deacetylase (PgdA/CDA1 family)